MSEEIRKILEARNVLPTTLDKYHNNLEGTMTDIIYLVGEDLAKTIDNVILPEEINAEEFKKVAQYLKTIGFFDLLKRYDL